MSHEHLVKTMVGYVTGKWGEDVYGPDYYVNFNLSSIATIILIIFFSIMAFMGLFEFGYDEYEDWGDLNKVAAVVTGIFLLVLILIALFACYTHEFYGVCEEDALDRVLHEGERVMEIIYLFISFLVITSIIAKLLFHDSAAGLIIPCITSVAWIGVILPMIHPLSLEFSLSLLSFPLGFVVGLPIAKIVENVRIEKEITREMERRKMEEERRRMEEQRRKMEEERRKRIERERKIEELKRKIQQWKEKGYDVEELERKLKEVE